MLELVPGRSEKAYADWFNERGAPFRAGVQVVNEVRRRVKQTTTGHRGRKGDPLFGIQPILRAGAETF